MESPSEAPPFLSQEQQAAEAVLVPSVDYDSTNRAFRLPLLLKPNSKTGFVLHGFRSAAGVLASPINIEFQVTGEELAVEEQARFDRAANDPQLKDALNFVRRNREQLTSLSERVQSLFLFRDHGLVVSLKSQGATFAWQKPDKFYADVSDMMLSCKSYEIGCDGQSWWWSAVIGEKTNLVACPIGGIFRREISICNPFGPDAESLGDRITAFNLIYLGGTRLRDTECQVFQGWKLQKAPQWVTYGSQVQWWIEHKTGRPIEVRQTFGDCVTRMLFHYDDPSLPILARRFAPPSLNNLTPAAPEPLDNDYTNRFVNLRDGSDGDMSVRWGKEGPKGRSSSGLN
jgi:hypothetical protein